MGVLADEYVRVRADTSYISKDIKKQGATSGKNLGKGILGGLKSIAGPVAVILGGLGVLSFLREASDAARESWKIGRQTNAVLKSTKGAANVTQKGIEKLADAISKKTGIDDEAVQSSENMLLTFTNVRNEVGKGNDIFDQATQMVQDMSVALGQDGKNSAIQLGKALNDPIKGVTALSRVGVTFTDQQKKQIKTLIEHGDKLGAQKVILGELSKEFGGSAAAQATWRDKAIVAMGNVQEKAGKVINKGLKPLEKWFVEKGAPAVDDFITKLGEIKFDKITTPNMDALFQAVKDASDEFLPPVKEEWTKIWQEAEKTAEVIKTAIDVDMIPALTRFLGATKGTGEGASDSMKLIRVALQIISFDTKRNMNTMAFILDHVATPALKNLVAIYHWVRTQIAEAWADVAANTGRRWEEIKASAIQWTGDIAGVFSRLAASVIGWVKHMWAGAKTSFIENHAAILGDVKRFWAGIVGFFTRNAAMVRTIWTGFWNGASRTASTVINTIRTTVSTVLGKIASGFTTGVKAIGKAWAGLEAAAKVPVKFVIETVLNDGLLGAVRAISKFVNYGPGKDIKVGLPSGWASGGVLPGYSPGRDIHRFYSATGGVLDLSGGEGIARPELVRAVGAKRWNAANVAARHGRVEEGLHYLGGFAQGASGIDATKAYARSIGITSIGTYPGHGSLGQNLSWDFMTGNRSKGEQLANWAWANAKQIHLWYEIYYRRIRSMTRPGAGWIPYTRSNPHTDHVHMSWYPAALSGIIGALSKAGAGIAGVVDIGKYTKMIDDAMGRLGEIKGSPFGEIVAGIPGKLVGAAKDKISSLAATMMSAVGGAFTAATGGSNRAIGHKMMLQRWPESQWPPLNSLWTRESGWRTTAKNPSSGAYGIPQSLPGSKMASAGADWRTNPATQIAWGLGYISSRYGNPAGAWAHSQRTGWYGMGGIINEPVLGVGMRTGRGYGFGERGPETVTPGIGGGGRPITINIDLGDGFTQRVQGLIDDDNSFRATIGRAR